MNSYILNAWPFVVALLALWLLPKLPGRNYLVIAASIGLIAKLFWLGWVDQVFMPALRADLIVYDENYVYPSIVLLIADTGRYLWIAFYYASPILGALAVFRLGRKTQVWEKIGRVLSNITN